MQKPTIKFIPDIQIRFNKRGYSVFAEVKNKSSKNIDQEKKYAKKNNKFLKELIINSKNQRNTLVKDFKKTKTRIHLIKLLRFLCFILLLYFLRPIRARIKKSLEKLEISKKALESGISCSYVNLDFELTERANKKYLLTTELFKKLTKSAFIWNIKSKTKEVYYRSPASQYFDLEKTYISTKEFKGFKSTFQPYFFNNKKGQNLFIFPYFAVIFNSNDDFEIVDIRDIDINFESINFIESGLRPKDSTVLYYVWEKSNNDGSRDLRYADNKEIPVMQYGETTFSYKSKTLGRFMFSNYEISQKFFNALSEFIYNPSIHSSKGWL